MTTFDLDFEDEILSQCMRDKDYLRGAAGIIEAHHFGTEQRGWVWETINDVWESSAELLTRKMALHRARGDFKDDEERVAAIEIIGKLKKLKPESPRAALTELGKFVRFTSISSGMEEAVRRIEKGDIDAAYERMGVVLADDRRGDDDWEVSRWIEEFNTRMVHQKNIMLNPGLYPAIKTGIKGLDKVTDGLRPTEMGIVASITNRGKSIFACHLGFHSINQGYGVVDFRTEMSCAQTAMRYDSRWTRMLHSKFKHFEFSDKEIKAIAYRLKKAKKRYKGLLRIISMPVTTATLPKMKRAVAEMRDEMENIGMIIIDSGDHVRGEDAGRRDFRFETAGVYWDIAGWAATDQLSIWVMTQLGKQAADRIGKSEDASEAYDKARIADQFVTINSPKRKSRATPKVMIGEDDDDSAAESRIKKSNTPGSGDLELFLAKYRDGVANIVIPLQTDLKRMLIQDRDDE